MTAGAMRLLVGFDGSRDATAAIEYGALLFPDAQATIAHIWMPPFTAHPSPELLRQIPHALLSVLVPAERQPPIRPSL
jgi:hypothetical protein